MREVIQATEAYALSVDVASTKYGHSLKLVSFVPSARHPEDQVKFQGVFSTGELRAFRDALDQAIAAQTNVAPTGVTVLLEGRVDYRPNV